MTQRKTTVLLTAPSLDERKKVSGISTLVRDIIAVQKDFNFIHLELGSADREKKNVIWMLKQFLVFPSILLKFVKHKIDIVHINCGLETLSIYRELAVFRIGKLLNKKTVFHIHGGYFLMNPPKKNSLIYKSINYMLYNADLVLTLSPLENIEIEKVYDFKKAIAIPNCVNLPSILLKPAFEAGKRFLVITYLGRIVESKGINEIVKAFELMADVFEKFEFRLYGAGLLQEGIIESLTNIKGLNFKYMGVASGEKKWEALIDSDIFLLPSIHSEGLPIAMLEAMASGCLVIVSDDASITSVVTDNENGVLVPKGDVNQLALAMKNYVNNPSAYGDIRKKAATTIKENFSMEKYSALLKEYYNGIL